MATVATGPAWSDHDQEGVTYSMRHLQPNFIEYSVPAIAPTARKPGRAALNIKVRLSYSHHCFTQSAEKLAAPNQDHFYNCTLRANETRVFCADRWAESLNLPAIIADLKTCFFTRHENYFVWRNPEKAELGEYFVYFKVSLNSGGFVDLFVQSAYPRTDGAREKKNAQKISLTALIVNTIRRKATHRPPQ